ncbi:MAG: hypothetical protein AAF682_01935 [Planctomycetota bacterium]
MDQHVGRGGSARRLRAQGMRRLRLLRSMPVAALRKLPEPRETLAIDGRAALLSAAITPLDDGGVRVLVRGSLAARFVPLALDGFAAGFRKTADGRVLPLSGE